MSVHYKLCIVQMFFSFRSENSPMKKSFAKTKKKKHKFGRKVHFKCKQEENIIAAGIHIQLSGN